MDQTIDGGTTGSEPGADSELVFGVYPGGLSVDAVGLPVGADDDPARTEEALAGLCEAGRPFLVRGYVHYLGDGRSANLTPIDRNGATWRGVSPRMKLRRYRTISRTRHRHMALFAGCAWQVISLPLLFGALALFH